VLAEFKGEGRVGGGGFFLCGLFAVVFSVCFCWVGGVFVGGGFGSLEILWVWVRSLFLLLLVFLRRGLLWGVLKKAR